MLQLCEKWYIKKNKRKQNVRIIIEQETQEDHNERIQLLHIL